MIYLIFLCKHVIVFFPVYVPHPYWTTCLKANGARNVCSDKKKMINASRGVLALTVHWHLTRYAKLPVAHAPGMLGTFFPSWTRKLLVSDPDMHHGTCVTHVPWCMLGSLTRDDGENVLGIPGACATRNVAYLVRGPWIYLTSNTCLCLWWGCGDFRDVTLQLWRLCPIDLRYVQRKLNEYS